METTLALLSHIVEAEFGQIVQSISLKRNKLRILLIDETYLDIFHSSNISERWAFHWECRHINNNMYRHDNIPHLNWKPISTFPWHFHFRAEDTVIDSDFTDNMNENCRKMMRFIQKEMKTRYQ